MSTSETSDTIKKNNHIAIVFNKTLSALNGHFSDNDMSFSRLIKSRAYNFSLHRTLHVGNFFRTLINEQYN